MNHLYQAQKTHPGPKPTQEKENVGTPAVSAVCERQGCAVTVTQTLPLFECDAYSLFLCDAHKSKYGIQQRGLWC